jgi:cytidine deaminase
MTDRELYEMALDVSKKAYAPYSNYGVGAVLVCDDGTLYTGFNIENASFGATVCAERVALFKAVSEGRRKFTAIAVASEREENCSPCGICRQTISEFAPELLVIYKWKDEIVKRPLNEILFDSFVM